MAEIWQGITAAFWLIVTFDADLYEIAARSLALAAVLVKSERS